MGKNTEDCAGEVLKMYHIILSDANALTGLYLRWRPQGSLKDILKPSGEEKTVLWPNQSLPHFHWGKGSSSPVLRSFVNTCSAVIFPLVYKGREESCTPARPEKGGSQPLLFMWPGDVQTVLLEAPWNPAGHPEPCHGIWGVRIATVTIKRTIKPRKEKWPANDYPSSHQSKPYSYETQFRSHQLKQACPDSFTLL